LLTRSAANPADLRRGRHGRWQAGAPTVLDAHGEALLRGTAARPAIEPNLGGGKPSPGAACLRRAAGRGAGAFNVISIDHAEAVEPALRPSARP